jgi:NADH:ubiquinone oxidoreductase subunit 4 (subunit M)
MPPLSILLWLPAVFGVLGALLSAAMPGTKAPITATSAGDGSGASEPAGATTDQARWSVPGAVALLGTVIALALAIGYIADYKSGGPHLQHVTDVVWIATLGIHYKLAITGLNVFLLGLTTLLFAVATLAANLRTWERPRLFYFFFLLAESAVLGAFLAQDLALFVAFFDLMLIPFYFLIGGWGREPDRIKATIKLVIYTLVGSLLMPPACSPPNTGAGTSPSCSPRCRRCR